MIKNIVVLVSGGGTNLQALIDAQERGEIKNGKITCVISSKEGAYALERAKNHNIKAMAIPRRDYPDVLSYSKKLLEVLKEENADLIVYAGFMTVARRSVRGSIATVFANAPLKIMSGEVYRNTV